MTALALARTEFVYGMPTVSISTSRKVYDLDALRLGPTEKEICNAIEAWFSDTEFMSSIDDMKRVLSFGRLVSLGQAALPKIIESLSKEPSLLGLVAGEIVGEDPITDEIRGDVRAMAGAWIGWYQRAKRDFV